ITQVPVKFVGEGEKIEDMDVFYPDRMADRILGMGDIVTLVEQAQEKMDMEASQKLVERMMAGKFTLEDMLIQMEQIGKLGPISGILKMIPGAGQLSNMISDEESEQALKRTKAMIQSMTPYEREHPEKIRNSMKRRIASGSGTSVSEVTKMINQYEKMKKSMDSMAALTRSGNLDEARMNKMMSRMQQNTKGQNLPLNMRNKKNPFGF
ncbi:MAG: signal recognition particle protein, partial [Erysipelotrichaceae bacterium]|nr:signal recognition particle protein [Erysipelotrichaceae bacterium]